MTADESGQSNSRGRTDGADRLALTRRAFLGTSLAAASGCLSVVRPPSSLACPATTSESVDARIGLAGDVMLGRGVDERWRDGPPTGVWGSMADYLRSLDGLFVNLECCLSVRGERRPDRTYYFRADPDWAIPALSAADVTWVSLANNHLLDYGPVALADTTAHLSTGGVAHAGAGSTLDATVRPSVVDVVGVEIAVLAFTDQSSSYAARENAPGTAFARLDPQDPRTRRLVGRALRLARDSASDLTIASLHWGPNWETRPSRTQRRFARWLVDRGVDVVHGHSAHVLQGVEVYRGRPIVYDAGDFVDDYAVKPGLHNDRSALFELLIEDGRVDALRLVPVEIENRAVEHANENAARWVRDRMRSLSGEFGTTFAREGTGLRVDLSDGCG